MLFLGKKDLNVLAPKLSICDQRGELPIIEKE